MSIAHQISYVEECPHCKQQITTEQTIIAGKAWHRKCWESTQNYDVKGQRIVVTYIVLLRFFLAHNISYVEECPHCKQQITTESTIVAGKAWHRKCWESTQNYDVKGENCLSYMS